MIHIAKPDAELLDALATAGVLDAQTAEELKPASRGCHKAAPKEPRERPLKEPRSKPPKEPPARRPRAKRAPPPQPIKPAGPPPILDTGDLLSAMRLYGPSLPSG